MEYSFLFPLMQKLWKSIKKCKTYSRKATGLCFSGHGVELGRFVQLSSMLFCTVHFGGVHWHLLHVLQQMQWWYHNVILALSHSLTLNNVDSFDYCKTLFISLYLIFAAFLMQNIFRILIWQISQLHIKSRQLHLWWWAVTKICMHLILRFYSEHENLILAKYAFYSICCEP